MIASGSGDAPVEARTDAFGAAASTSLKGAGVTDEFGGAASTSLTVQTAPVSFAATVNVTW